MVHISPGFHVSGFSKNNFLHTPTPEMPKFKTTRSTVLVDPFLTTNIPPGLVSVERHSDLISLH
jgi:hypothetical protein